MKETIRHRELKKVYLNEWFMFHPKQGENLGSFGCVALESRIKEGTVESYFSAK